MSDSEDESYFIKIENTFIANSSLNLKFDKFIEILVSGVDEGYFIIKQRDGGSNPSS